MLLKIIIVYVPVILGPIDYFSESENLVSFERAMFVNYSYKYRRKISRGEIKYDLTLNGTNFLFVCSNCDSLR